METLKNYSSYLKESILDPVRETLSPDLFENGILISSAKEQVLNIFNTWMKHIKLEEKPSGIKLTGSMATYQWNDESDIDINVDLFNVPKGKIERLKEILPQGNYLKGTKHPINFFLNNIKASENTQQAIYDILENKWITKPSKDASKNLKDYYKMALNQAISWARKISLDLDEMRRNALELQMFQHFLEDEAYHKDEKEVLKMIENQKIQIQSSYDILKMDLHMLKTFRNEAYSPSNDPFKSKIYPEKTPHPDFSINNVIYKILEKFKYIDQLKEAKEKYKNEFPELLKEN